MKVAIIGLGVIGNVHIMAIGDKAEIVAVCDIDQSKKGILPTAKFYTDYKEMLSTEDIDVVHICTPHYLHTEMVVYALNHDINVFCEKPLCIKEEDIDKILTAEANSKAKLGVCMQNRYNQNNIFVKDYLKGKNIKGGVAYLSWNRGKPYYDSASWRGKWETEGGGVMINQALHTFDIMQWLIGYPKKITASISNLSLQGVIEVEDTASIVCETENTKYTMFATNANSYSFPVHVCIRADEDTIEITENCVIINGEVKEFKPTGKCFGKDVYGTGHQTIIEDFYDCVKEDRPFSLNGKEAMKVVKMILATYKSNGAKIEL